MHTYTAIYQREKNIYANNLDAFEQVGKLHM